MNAAKQGKTTEARPVDRPDSRTKRAGTSQDAKPVPPIRFYPASRICIGTTLSDALREQVPYGPDSIDGLSRQVSLPLRASMEKLGMSAYGPGGKNRFISAPNRRAPSISWPPPTPAELAALQARFWREDCPDNGLNIRIDHHVDVNAQGQPYAIRLDVRQGAARWTTEIARKGDRSDWPSIPPIPDYGVSASMAIDEDSYMLGERLADYLFDQEKIK